MKRNYSELELQTRDMVHEKYDENIELLKNCSTNQKVKITRHELSIKGKKRK